MPKIPLGCLYRVNAPAKFNMPQNQLAMCQILGGVHALHTAGITHRDIKPPNVLVQSFEPLHLLITDFGLCSIRDTQSYVGTDLYQAPEIGRRLRGTTGPYNSKVDIWSCGMLLLFLLGGDNDLLEIIPLFIENETSWNQSVGLFFQRIFSSDHIQTGYHEPLLLVFSMVNFWAENRPDARDCLCHPWLRAQGMPIPPVIDPAQREFLQKHSEAEFQAIKLGHRRSERFAPRARYDTDKLSRQSVKPLEQFPDPRQKENFWI